MADLCKTCIHQKVCFKDKNICGDVYVSPNPWFFDDEYKRKSWERYLEWEAKGFPCDDYIACSTHVRLIDADAPTIIEASEDGEQNG